MILTRWSDFDRDLGRRFAALDEIRRHMDDVVRQFGPTGAGAEGDVGATYPRANLYDDGTSLVLYAAVPGLSADDLAITATGDVLSVAGTRTVSPPEGYSVHRRERADLRFSRSFALPAPIDWERVDASVVDGLLTVRLHKAPEAQPRQIAVKAS